MNENDIIVIDHGTMTMVYLSEAVSRAEAQGRKLSLNFGETLDRGPFLKFKVGEDMWSPPLFTERVQ